MCKRNFVIIHASSLQFVSSRIVTVRTSREKNKLIAILVYCHKYNTFASSISNASEELQISLEIVSLIFKLCRHILKKREISHDRKVLLFLTIPLEVCCFKSVNCIVTLFPTETHLRAFTEWISTAQQHSDTSLCFRKLI